MVDSPTIEFMIKDKDTSNIKIIISFIYIFFLYINRLSLRYKEHRANLAVWEREQEGIFRQIEEKTHIYVAELVELEKGK